MQTSPMSHYIADTYRGEVDYYLKTGTVINARLDRGTAKIDPQPTMHTRAWGIGGERALTPLGNVVLRAAYQPGARRRPGGACGHYRQTFPA